MFFIRHLICISIRLLEKKMSDFSSFFWLWSSKKWDVVKTFSLSNFTKSGKFSGNNIFYSRAAASLRLLFVGFLVGKTFFCFLFAYQATKAIFVGFLLGKAIFCFCLHISLPPIQYQNFVFILMDVIARLVVVKHGFTCLYPNKREGPHFLCFLISAFPCEEMSR